MAMGVVVVVLVVALLREDVANIGREPKQRRRGL